MFEFLVGREAYESLIACNRLVQRIDIQFMGWLDEQLESGTGFRFSSEALLAISEVEQAVLKDHVHLRFSTKFGDRLTPSDFSSGVKTLLAIIYDICPGCVYDMNGAGPNVWDFMFKHFQDLNREFYCSYFPAIANFGNGVNVNGVQCGTPGAAMRVVYEVLS